MATGFLHQRIPNGIRKATTDYGQRHIVETAIVIAGVAGTEFKSLGSESVIKHADGRNVLNGLNWRCAAAVDAERLMLPHSLKASHLVLCLPILSPRISLNQQKTSFSGWRIGSQRFHRSQNLFVHLRYQFRQAFELVSSAA